MIKTDQEIFSNLWTTTGAKAIPGWWKNLLFYAYEEIDKFQTEESIEGNLGEIGIYHGRSLIPLSNFRKENEIMVCMENGKWTEGKEPYKQNLINAFGSLDGFEIYHESSENTKRFHKYNPFRIFYIDGSHTYEMTLNDLRIAGEVLNEKGILFLDDYANPKLGGPICKAVDKFLEENSEFRIPFTVGESLFICKQDMVESYNNCMAKLNWIVSIDKKYLQAHHYIHPNGLQVFKK